MDAVRCYKHLKLLTFKNASNKKNVSIDIRAQCFKNGC